MKWRVIITDSESFTGVAPVCPRQDGLEHRRTDTADVFQDYNGVYDCCPHPHIETWSESSADALRNLLNAIGAEPCS
jgi:hypothetical protein